MAPLRRHPFALELFFDLLALVDGAADFADLIEQALFMDLFFLEVLAFLVALFLDDLAYANFMLRQFLAEIEDMSQGQRAGKHFVEDAIFAVFDLLGDLDFAFAAQQRHRAHLAQIHPHRIAGLTDHVVVGVLGLFFLFLVFDQLVACTAQSDPLVGVDDFDVHLAEDRHDIVDLIRRDNLSRQHIVDIVVGQIALFLT